MGLFSFFRKPKPRVASSGLPEQYKGFRDGLAPGQMIPARRADGVVSMIVRETDAGIAQIGRDPTVAAVSGTITYGEARIVCLLAQIAEDPRCTYEIIFDLMRPECVDDLNALRKQHELNVAVVGETTWTGVEAPMPSLGATIGAHADLALSSGQRWAANEFMAGVNAVRSLSRDTAGLWEVFEREGQAVEIRATG